MFGFPEAALDDRRQRVDLTHWAFDPGNVAPTAGLERDVGQSTLTRFGLPIVTVRSGSNGRPPKSKDTCKPNTVTDPRLAFSISCANPENGTTSWRNRDGERRSDTQC